MCVHLNGIGCKQHRGLWRAVDVVAEHRLFHLQVEQMLSQLLYQLLTHIGVWIVCVCVCVCVGTYTCVVCVTVYVFVWVHVCVCVCVYV